jgi:hypothetical protein
MKTKLTLTIEKDLIPRAKRFAQARGDFLSCLVEKAIHNVIQTDRTSFSTRWSGKFKASRRRSGRYKLLSRRYL